MINAEIHNIAVKKGICKDWAKRLKNATDKQLAEMFFNGSDWAFENDFPTKALLNEYDGVKDFGLCLDVNNETFTSVENVAFFGNSKATLIYNNFEVADVYVRHDSNVTIEATNYAIVNVSVEDQAKVFITKDSTAKVNVRRYSGTVEGDCNVTDSIYEQ